MVQNHFLFDLVRHALNTNLPYRRKEIHVVSCLVLTFDSVLIVKKHFFSVVDRHRFDDDPDQDFHVDSDPDPDPDRHRNNADPHADPTSSFTHVGKSVFVILLVTALHLPLYNFYLSHQCHMCPMFSVF
jgi:hypothetical protein